MKITLDRDGKEDTRGGKLDSQIRKTVAKMEEKGGKTGRQWRRPERKGRRGGAIVSRILPELLQETKGTGALATTSQRTPRPGTSL